MIPQKPTSKEIRALYETAKSNWQTWEQFSNALVDLRDQQWKDLLSSTEPYGWVSQHTTKGPYEWQFSKERAGIYPDTAISILPVFLYPNRAVFDVLHKARDAINALLAIDSHTILSEEDADKIDKDLREAAEACMSAIPKKD